MSYNLNGKVALVTGAASGIGATVVKYLLDEDVKHVATLDIAEEAGVAWQNMLNTKYKENKVKFIKCDVTDKESLLKAFNTVIDEYSYIDLVINSAGILDDTLESCVKAININVTALVTSSLLAWNLMNKEKGGFGGTIINFSSASALCKVVTIPIYSCTKSAVLKFSTILGDDLHYSRSGARVICMCFGVTETPMPKNSHKVFDRSIQTQSVDIFKQLKSQSPEAAAKAVIEAYKQGASGSVWISSDEKPGADITDLYNETVEIFHAKILG